MAFNNISQNLITQHCEGEEFALVHSAMISAIVREGIVRVIIQAYNSICCAVSRPRMKRAIVASRAYRLNSSALTPSRYLASGRASGAWFWSTTAATTPHPEITRRERSTMHLPYSLNNLLRSEKFSRIMRPYVQRRDCDFREHLLYMQRYAKFISCDCFTKNQIILLRIFYWES